jgi:hypothetical protein
MILHTYGYQKVAKDGGTHITINNGGDSSKSDSGAPKGENAVTKGLQAGAGATAAVTAVRAATSDDGSDSILKTIRKKKAARKKAEEHAAKAAQAKQDGVHLKDKWFRWADKSKAKNNLRYESHRAKHYAREAENLSKHIGSKVKGRLATPAAIAAGLAGAAHFTSNKDERDEAKKQKKDIRKEK